MGIQWAERRVDILSLHKSYYFWIFTCSLGCLGRLVIHVNKFMSITSTTSLRRPSPSPIQLTHPLHGRPPLESLFHSSRNELLSSEFRRHNADCSSLGSQRSCLCVLRTWRRQVTVSSGECHRGRVEVSVWFWDLIIACLLFNTSRGSAGFFEPWCPSGTGAICSSV